MNLSFLCYSTVILLFDYCFLTEIQMFFFVIKISTFEEIKIRFDDTKK